MKTLQKLLLINWHFIVHETIELKRLNFLTGKTGSGWRLLNGPFRRLPAVTRPV